MLGKQIYYRFDAATVRPGIIVRYWENGFSIGVDRFNIIVFLDGLNDGVVPPDAPIVWKSSVKIGMDIEDIMPFASTAMPFASNTIPEQSTIVIVQPAVIPALQPSMPDWYSPIWCGDTH